MRVRFGHADPAKIAFYPRFFEWFHEAFEAMFEAITGMSYAEILERRRIGFPAVQALSDFRKAVRFGDLLEIEVFLSRLSPRSATFEYRLLKDRELMTAAAVKVAFVDLDHFRGTELPPDLAAALLPYVEQDPDLPDATRLR